MSGGRLDTARVGPVSNAGYEPDGGRAEEGAPGAGGARDRMGWYWRRIRRMSADEMWARALDLARQRRWASLQVRPGDALPPPPPTTRCAPHRLPHRPLAMPGPALAALLARADEIAAGRWEVLGVSRDDMAAPDWFTDPLTGRRAPHDRYCFRINHRSEWETGNVKQLWELSRHHHLTVLAAAWYASGDDRYPVIVDRHLRDWWQQNPFLSGVHWTSGIELGIRLISWTWIRRLLDGWDGAADLFEGNDDFARQLHWHQRFLASFQSAGTSANNHAVAEAAGQLVASCAFPWFADSGRWREGAATVLERELERNTFPSGVNREQASTYHAFVAELGILGGVEAGAAGHPLGDATWTRLRQMLDAAAALVDQNLRPPRQGDGDDGRALVVDGRPPTAGAGAGTDERGGGDPEDGGGWASLLATGAARFGAAPWWPAADADVRSTLLAALARTGPPPPSPSPAAGSADHGARPARRPDAFDDAGVTMLRTPADGDRPEIWCRCDAGPHGYLAIAAHAHADALSVEVRHGGVDVLADPGTYCYHGEPGMRAYFRSTIGHNTLELGGTDQSRSGGPFLWERHAVTHPLSVVPACADDRDPDIVTWAAQHDGYAVLDPPALHRRTVRLDRRRLRLEIVDTVVSAGPHPCRLAFHLGPAVRTLLDGSTASLGWTGPDGPVTATLRLPHKLRWTCHRGEDDPVLGWYSPGFGRRVPSVTLVGSGFCGADTADGHDLVTVLQFSRAPLA